MLTVPSRPAGGASCGDRVCAGTGVRRIIDLLADKTVICTVDDGSAVTVVTDVGIEGVVKAVRMNPYGGRSDVVE
jgi:hypothetical protein